ncbi:hypothetical protein KWI83_26390 [Streptomyces sp. TRM70350]|nr:hypothetical protein [Streptomyces sp. TRM70350]MBV7699018.1 hypothetical protein [Streptomyces sp. TRM70350]
MLDRRDGVGGTLVPDGVQPLAHPAGAHIRVGGRGGLLDQGDGPLQAGAG